jgi:hypothetical protein
MKRQKKHQRGGPHATTATTPMGHIDTALARRLGVEASADPRSVVKEFVSPHSVRGDAGYRIRQVLSAHGLLKE